MWKIKGWVCFKGLQDVYCWSNLCCIINFLRVSFLILCSFLLLFFFLWRTINSPNIIFLILCSSPFLQHRRYILVIGHARLPNSVQNENCKLSLCRISNFCARCLQSVFGAIFAIWLQTLRCTNFTIFVVMWPVLHEKHRFLKMHQRRRNTLSANGVYLKFEYQQWWKYQRKQNSARLHIFLQTFAFLSQFHLIFAILLAMHLGGAVSFFWRHICTVDFAYDDNAH